MKFKPLDIFVRSASFELQTHTVYHSPNPYTVFLDGHPVLTGQTTNVFSLYDLTPNTRYTVAVEMDGARSELTFTTAVETVCLDVQRFGAVPDGKTLSTAALQAAIFSCPAGGTVYVPRGIYLTGPLFLKSAITLYLEKGAVLLGHAKREQYPILPGMTRATDERDEYYLGTWEGNPLDAYASLLTGIEVQQVCITGQGVLDANAQNADWWINAKVRTGAWRPRMLFLCRCQNTRVQGVQFLNSYAWTLHPYFSQHIRLLDISIRNCADSPNTDGIDLESCYQVEIVGARISVGDDCIALKSGKRFMAERLKTPSRNVEVRNCLLERGHGGVVVGSEVSAGVQDLRVRQCLFINTDRGLRIKTRRGRSDHCVLDEILLENIIMKGVPTPFNINMFYFCDPDGHSSYVSDKNPLPVGEDTPRVGRLVCRNIVCTDCSVAGGYFYGLPEMPIESVELENIRIAFDPDAREGYPVMMDYIPKVKKLGIFACNLKSLRLKNIVIEGYEGERVVTQAIEQFEED